MRDAIARALFRVLDLIPLTRRTAPGRHTAQHLTHQTCPDPDGDRPWAKPWPGPSSHQARSVFRAEEARALDPERRERFYATAWAELGYDYPYTAPGIHQAQVPTGRTA
ncbi:hypothetical protein [Streptomyces uncialis]|uniref:hypothetical protein n=1 Tax=Streptomyces uncialis TaxID=1048205 RepID=UPI0034090C3C